MEWRKGRNGNRCEIWEKVKGKKRRERKEEKERGGKAKKKKEGKSKRGRKEDGKVKRRSKIPRVGMERGRDEEEGENGKMGR